MRSSLNPGEAEHLFNLFSSNGSGGTGQVLGQGELVTVDESSLVRRFVALGAKATSDIFLSSFQKGPHREPTRLESPDPAVINQLDRRNYLSRICRRILEVAGRGQEDVWTGTDQLAGAASIG